MGIQEVTIHEYECNGCGHRQYGQIGEEVFGIAGSFSVHTKGGGNYFEYWACSPKCHAKAIKKALDARGNSYA